VIVGNRCHGLGEQAFSVYDAHQGRVMFRLRNVLVEVDYLELLGKGMSVDQAIKGAYTTATYVTRALHG
jgi:hypothetical protein